MTLSFALAAHLVVVSLVLIYLVQRVDRVMSLTGLALAMLVVVHGVPLTIYLLITGPEGFIFEAALSRVNRDETLVRIPLAVSAMFISLIVGIELVNTVLSELRRRGQQAQAHQPAGVLYRNLGLSPLARAGFWCVTISMLAVSVMDGQAAKVVDYFASGESELGKIMLRVEGGGTPYYAYNVALASLAPFMAMVAYCGALRQRHLLSLRWLTALLFIAVLLGKFGTLSKAPPVIFLLQLLLLRTLLKRQLLGLRTATLLGAAAFALFAMMVHWTIPDLDTLAVIKFLYYRVFDIPNEGLLEYFAAVPTSVPHGGGGGIFAFLRNVPAADYIPMYSAVAEVTRDSLVSTSNSMFIADAWAEFGWWGVVVFSILAGSVLRSIDLFAFRNGESDESACLVAGGAYGIFTMLSTSLTTSLITGGLVLMPVMALALRRRKKRPLLENDARALPLPKVTA